MQMPEQLHAVEARAFMQHVEPLLQADFPRIDFGCSQVRSLDGACIGMMLHCLEEAMKHDGNLKLAALSPESKAVLELLREARVLQAFASSDDAVRGFNALPLEGISKSASSSFNLFRDMGSIQKASSLMRC